MNRKRHLCIWLPDWPIQRLRAVNATPLESHAPTASPKLNLILWQESRHGRVVVARDAYAASLGVRNGMTIAEAGDLAKRGDVPPQVEFHDPRLDQAALEQLAHALLVHISPLVAIERLDKESWAGQTLHQPQTIGCEINGIEHLFGGEAGLLEATEHLLNDWGYDAKLAISDSFATGWALTHYGPKRSIVVPGESESAISELPVEAMRLSPETVSTLARLGVYTIGSLLKLPRGGLAARLGETLVHRIAECLSEVEEPLPAFRPPAEFSASHDLEYPTDDQNILVDRIERLIESLAKQLSLAGRGALRLSCNFHLNQPAPISHDVGLFIPTHDAAHLKTLILSGLENRTLPAPVERLSIDIQLTGLIRTTQASLFAEMNGEWTHHTSTARLIDTLSSRLGRDAVLGVCARRDPLPENGYRSFQLTGTPRHARRASGGASRSKKQRRAPESTRDDSETLHASLQSPLTTNQRRPLQLFSQPPSIQVELSPQAFYRRPPQRFRYRNRWHPIARHWGPERIETGWWYGPCIRRDYYRVETEAGWWWIFCDLATGEWFLHGLFS